MLQLSSINTLKTQTFVNNNKNKAQYSAIKYNTNKDTVIFGSATKPSSNIFKKIFSLFQSKLKPIKRFQDMGDGIYRGAQPNIKQIKTQLQFLKDKGITDIISFINPKEIPNEVKAAKKLGINHHQIVISLAGDSGVPYNSIEKALNIINQAKGSTFMHCKHGKDRTGLMAGAIRVAKQGWKKQDASKEMLEFNLSMHEVTQRAIETTLNNAENLVESLKTETKKIAPSTKITA